MGDDFFGGSSFSYSFGTYDAFSGFNSIGGSGYAGQNVTYQGTTATGFDAFTSNPYLTSTTTTGFVQDQSIVGTANYQIGVDYTNNAVSGFANPNTGGTQALSLDNTYYTIQNGSDAYLTSQFNAAGSIATIQTATATVIANTQGDADSGDYGSSVLTPGGDDLPQNPTTNDTVAFDPNADFNPSSGYRIRIDGQGDLTVSASDYQATIVALFDETRSVVPSTISSAVEEALITTQAFQSGATNLRVIGPGIDVYRNEAQSEIDLAGSTQSYYDRIQEIAFAQADGDPAFANLVRPADFGFDLATETFATEEDAELYSLAVQQRVVEVITSGIQTVSDKIAIATQIISQNPEIFATSTVSPTGETYYTLKSLFDIAETLREVSEDPVVITVIGSQIAAAGGDVSQADLRATTIVPLVDQLRSTNIQDVLPDTSPEQQILIDQRIASIAENRTVSADEYAQIQQEVLSSTLIQSQQAGVDNYSLRGGDGGGGGTEVGDEGFDTVAVEDVATEENTTVVDAGEDPNVLAGEEALDETTSTEGGLIQSSATDVGGSYSAVYNPETGTYDVVNDDTGTVVLTGLTQQQAILAAEDYSIGITPDIASDGPVDYVTPEDVSDVNLYPNGLPYDDEGNLMPGWSLDEFNNPVWVGYNSDGTLFVEPATLLQAEADREAALTLAATNRARSQQVLLDQQRQANQGDWRVKLRLAPGSQYLYNEPGLETPDDGVLWPLKITQGVVFPYTPIINTVYGANYSNYDLTHSNMRGYFYQNSYVDEITIQAVFTAQDTSEANYMLAMIHFFRSVTKMFYGQDAQRGMPPPLVFLQGLGEYQFNMHPCLVKSFSYNLPNDVDYIRARSVNINGTNLLARRDRQTLASGSDFLSSIRLNAAGLNPGGLTPPPAPPILGTESPTYVPTRLEVNITLLPTQSRDQVSKQFSLKQFANGDLIKAGFW